jgi:hypothetical protein
MSTLLSARCSSVSLESWLATTEHSSSSLAKSTPRKSTTPSCVSSMRLSVSSVFLLLTTLPVSSSFDVLLCGSLL